MALTLGSHTNNEWLRSAQKGSHDQRAQFERIVIRGDDWVQLNGVDANRRGDLADWRLARRS